MDKNVVRHNTSRHNTSRRRLLQATARTLYAAGLLTFLDGCGRTPGASSTGRGDAPLEIACDGNTLVFAPTRLTAQTGQRVSLTFSNVSTTFQHNWVLVAGGNDIADAVNQAATAAGPRRDYMPADTSAILAHTELIGPGETDRITFTVPSPGEYIFLCTYPGHYLAGMRGTLVVDARA